MHYTWAALDIHLEAATGTKHSHRDVYGNISVCIYHLFFMSCTGYQWAFRCNSGYWFSPIKLFMAQGQVTFNYAFCPSRSERLAYSGFCCLGNIILQDPGEILSLLLAFAFGTASPHFVGPACPLKSTKDLALSPGGERACWMNFPETLCPRVFVFVFLVYYIVLYESTAFCWWDILPWGMCGFNSFIK